MDAYDTSYDQAASDPSGGCCTEPIATEPVVEPVPAPVVETVPEPVVEAPQPAVEPVAPVAEPVPVAFDPAPAQQVEVAQGVSTPAPAEASIGGPAASVDATADLRSVLATDGSTIGGPTPGINQVTDMGGFETPTSAIIGGPTPGINQVTAMGDFPTPTTAIIGGPTPGINQVTDTSGPQAPTYAVIGNPTYNGMGALLESGDPAMASYAAYVIGLQQNLAAIQLQPSESELAEERRLGIRR